MYRERYDGTSQSRPEWWYSFLRACGDPPMGVSPRKTTPSMSKAIPNDEGAEAAEASENEREMKE